MSPIQPLHPSTRGLLESLALWLGRLSLLRQAVVVSSVVGLVWLVLSAGGWCLSGSAGVLAASVAAGICLMGAWLALALSVPWQGSTGSMYAMLAGMLVRLFVALPLGVVLQLQMPVLAEASMIFYLLLCYLATLAVETALLVAKVQAQALEPGAV